MKTFISGIMSGLLVSIGGTVFLACDNRYVGAVMFAVALLCICYKGYYLFTGKIGYSVEKGGEHKVRDLIVGLAGNAVGAYGTGVLVALAKPQLNENAVKLVSGKLAMDLLPVFFAGCMCGVLMYMAVSIYRDNRTALGILFCIPVFILSGFEHSIADMFYFAAAMSFGVPSLLFVITVVLGNAVGAILVSLATIYIKKEKS